MSTAPTSPAPPPVVVVQGGSPNLIVRFIWFVCVGWWASALWSILSWIAAVTIVGLPLTIWMLNRIPQVATLKLDRRTYAIDEAGVLREDVAAQRPFWQRALYFVIVGWWFSAIWLTLAWLAGISLIGLPLAFWMYGAAGKVLTLKR